MRSYERSNVTVDQCTECRGIFLDRGELERLVDAEAAWAGQQPRQAPQPQESHHQPQRSYPEQPPYPQPDDRHQPYPNKKRRKSFFEELFD